MKKLILLITCIGFAFPAAADQNWKAVLRYDKQAAKADLAAHLQKYAAQDSHALLQTDTAPSTKQQLSFAKTIAKQLKQIGASNVQVSKTGIVTAEIPATINKPVAPLALIARLDTPPHARAQQPQAHSKYTGGDLILNKKENIRLTEENSRQLLRAHGHDFLTSDGTAPFGADTKAGLAILMTLTDYLLANPSLQHGMIQLIILPDGISHAGAETLDFAALGTDYAYTLGAADLGEMATTNFSGRTFTAVFDGRRDIPLGQAIATSFSDNLLMASDFHTLLPRNRRPETTSGMQGYITVDNIVTQGNRSVATGHIRAFTEEDLQQLTNQVTQAFNTVKAMNPRRVGAELVIQDQFANGRNKVQQPLVQLMEKSMRKEDINTKPISVRSNTDFAILTRRGLPTVAVFTGVFHGAEPLEYADVDIMEASLRTLINTVLDWPEQTLPEK